jgi:hypothetical protein
MDLDFGELEKNDRSLAFVEFEPVFRIRIHIYFSRLDPVPEGKNDKNDPQKWKKVKEFSRAEGFSCSLDVLCGGIGTIKLHFLFKEIVNLFSAVNFTIL